MTDKEHNPELLDDEQEESSDSLGWYALRVLRNEERCVAQIKEHIVLRKLQDKITDVKYLKEYTIVESEEFDPHSEFLPKRGFKSTPTSVWVRLTNGNYRRIRIVEKKPLSGMVFIRMVFDMDLFKMIRSWDAGYSFLGFPHPAPISENQLNKTVNALDDSIPSLEEYAKEKSYQLVEGTIVNIEKKYPKPKPTPVEEVEETTEETLSEEAVEESKEAEKVIVQEDEPLEDAEPVKVLSPEEEKEAQKARIYSELNIQDNLKGVTEVVEAAPKPTPAKKTGTFNVNDFVFIKHLGFKGNIQEIDYDADRVVVGVQMFGRRQPVECKVKDIQLI